MANVLTFEKVTALPTTLTPSTYYLVKNGAGFDLYVTSSDGSAAIPLNLPTAQQRPSYINSILAGTLTIVNGVNRWYSPVALSVSTVEMFVSQPATGADIIVNINVNGVLKGTYTLPASSYYVSLPVTSFALNAGDYLTYDVTQIGSTNAGSDLQLRLTY